ncbi:DUF3784 domain-containing protein [Halobacillus sp. BBL2006]|uniref:DUF3784 domain-containing protein n=1 Tax=Halobacillus sp. BBL2006 TaxID=1543706 RepID=UPI000543E6CD|nr:DUF3784 domain-containing protein [Halobacillus sp. BBL2006]KHE72928.1 hypothetical protein LD39_01960 [Halobacillus sp. BBL2006]
MDTELLVIGILFLVVSFLVGVLKQTWLLSGFNEKAIKDKARLGRVSGSMFFLPVGVCMILNSLIDYPNEQFVLLTVSLILLVLVYFYINRKLLN